MNDSERESTTSADEARLRAIENNQETTVSNAKVVDNDHLVEDANTERKLTVTHEALAREKTKRRSKPLLVFLLALLLVLLGGLAGALVYKSFFEQSAPSTTSTSSNNTVRPIAIDSTNATSLTAEVTGKLTGSPVETVTSGNFAMTKDNYAAFSVPAAKAPDAKYYTYPGKISGVTRSYTDAAKATHDVETVRAYLEDKGLAAGTLVTDEANQTISSTLYSSDALRCSLTQTAYKYGSGNQVNFGCADMKSYTETTTQLKPIYDVYAKDAKDAQLVGLILGAPKIAASKTAGYQTAEVSTNNVYYLAGGAVALFYQTPDKSWHYLASTQQVLSCSDYTTPEAKAAFAGTSCMDGSKESKVNP